MEMKNAKDYLLWIREQVGEDQIIIVPNTAFYQNKNLKFTL